MIKTVWYYANHLPESGLAAFLIKVVLTIVLYVVGSKVIGVICGFVRKQLGKLKIDEAAKEWLPK